MWQSGLCINPLCLIHIFIWLYCMVPLNNVYGSQVGPEGTSVTSVGWKKSLINYIHISHKFTVPVVRCGLCCGIKP